MSQNGPGRQGWRRLALGGVAVLGIVSIVGSGGGIGDSTGSDDGCRREDRFFATVDPQRAVVAVGDSITFAALPDFPATKFTWSRCRQGRCTGLGVTSENTYTLSGLSLQDDGSTVEVIADGCWWVQKGIARIEVLPSPGTGYGDGEFRSVDWETNVLPGNTQGSTQSFTQSAAGGSPGAFGAVGYRVVPPSSEVLVFHGSVQATYDPRVQGAVYAVDLAVDCRLQRLDGGTFILPRKAFLQAGRWYQARSWPGSRCEYDWSAALDRSSLSLDHFDFELVAGPPCGLAEACPDFSATGAPIRFGFIAGLRPYPAAAVATFDYGIDNWKVTVWRK